MTAKEITAFPEELTMSRYGGKAEFAFPPVTIMSRKALYLVFVFF